MAVADPWEEADEIEDVLDALTSPDVQDVYFATTLYGAKTLAAVAAFRALGSAGGGPTGVAGGVLAGSYPNPSFAANMATQAELDAAVATLEDAIDGLAGATTAAGIYNVLDYGAIGDGTTNDLAACRLAVAAANAASAGTVYFPGGKTYLLQGTAYGQDMLAPTGDVRMVGGAGATLKTGIYGGAVQIAVGAVSNVEVSGLTFDHGNLADTIAVRFSASTHCTVENCTLNGTGAIFTYISGAASHLMIRNNMTRKGYGVLTHDSATCTHITVQGNRFLGGSVGEGIEINTPTGASSDWLITGNRINGYTATGSVGGFGIAVAHADRVNIVGNYISNMVNAAMRFEDGCSDVNVVGNYIYNVNEHGIYCIYGNANQMDNFLIDGNVLRQVGKIGTSWDTTRTDAIAIIAGGAGFFRGLRISNNYIVDCGETGTVTAGIGFTSFENTDIAITGNTVRHQLGNVAGATPAQGIYCNLVGAIGSVIITDNICIPVASTDRPISFGSTTGGTVSGIIANNSFLGGIAALDPAAGTWVIKDNIGYKTEANGATSVADGGTITHGLGQTVAGLVPTVVTVTPSVASEMVSVTAKTSTSFTVAIRKQDGDTGTTQTVYWRASIYA